MSATTARLERRGLDVGEIICRPDGFYCYNVSVSPWADAVTNRLEGTALYLLEDVLAEVAREARAAAAKLAARIGDLGGAVTANPRELADRSPGEFMMPADCADRAAILAIAALNLATIIDAYDDFLDLALSKDHVGHHLVTKHLGQEPTAWLTWRPPKLAVARRRDQRPAGATAPRRRLPAGVAGGDQHDSAGREWAFPPCARQWSLRRHGHSPERTRGVCRSMQDPVPDVSTVEGIAIPAWQVADKLPGVPLVGPGKVKLPLFLPGRPPRAAIVSALMHREHLLAGRHLQATIAAAVPGRAIPG